ncbi:putative sodium-dependent multivitamin transporter [Argiope bruennichi]|nr:putative sodium-dependent multivitamin transporter [Argiope bruennichi]
MSAKLGIVDYIVVAIMLAVCALIGVYFRCTGGRQKTTNEFLMGNRRMQITPVAISLIAMSLSSISVLGIPAETYLYGTQIFLAAAGIPIGGLFAAYGLLPVFYDMKVSTVYEYLEKRFGKTSRTIVATLFTLQTILYMGVVLYAPAIALNAVTGLSTWASILTLAAVCMFYSSQGGLKAVLWTVVFQSALMYLCMIAVIVKICLMLGFTEIVEIADKGGRFIFDEFSGDLTIRYSFWNSLINGIFFYTYLYGVNQAQVQRYLSLGNLKKAQKALMWSFPLLLLFNLIIFWDGISLYALFHDCDPMKDENVKLSSADQLMPYGILKIYGDIPGLTGLCIAGVFSASLGTLSSAVNALANITIEDFIKPFCHCKKVNDTWMAFIAKLLAIGYICLILLMALVTSSFRAVLEASNVVLGMTAGPILGMYILGMFTTKANEPGTLIGLLSGVLWFAWAGFGSYITKPKVPTLSRDISGCYANSTWGVFNATTSTPFTEEVTEILKFTERKENDIFYLYTWSYMWLLCIALAITIVVGYVASYVLSFCIDPANVKSEYLSPFVRKLYFSPTYTAVRTKASDIEMEMNAR